ncbi:MAG: bifunctional indole-3-glycerol-phosphate synthase TrpC/phosphoribosylanthranilate isomerase TrpF [Gammaproteobacteria bacterium]|nr:bifunctional indole-3-glycerol-phosphate synthase TrpC/phosphoribosylanthranilate isomerase TrpF [Gammaproteobacteria bacterium]
MNVLEKIVIDKREEVAVRKQQLPLQQFISELTPSDRDFKQALIDDHQNKGAAYILECKKASPSKGLIRPVFDLDEICDAYKQYASCVSVLTDEKYFQGEFERLPLVREKLHQPILCKDFFVDEYQVHLARKFGANAILLMLSVLDDQEYAELATAAKHYGMAILTEVSNEEEMHRAVALKADILGVNNRNLRDLSTDLNKTPELVSLFKAIADEEQQQNTVLISESGIYNHQQVKLLLKDVKGFLVGSSLMAQKDISLACRDLIKGEFKVCGLKKANDVNAAIDSGAKYQGLIFVEKSPRYISPEDAVELKESFPDANFVTVVQNMPLKELMALAQQLQPAAIQLHGDEDENYINELRQELAKLQCNTEIWQAVAISEQLPDSWSNVDNVVLDTKNTDGTSGGSGQTFDWRVLNQINLDCPPILLAGGINNDNALEALTYPVSGLDINSGVESQKGVKSEQKIQQIFTTIYNR